MLLFFIFEFDGGCVGGFVVGCGCFLLVEYFLSLSVFFDGGVRCEVFFFLDLNWYFEFWLRGFLRSFLFFGVGIWFFC